ncbi:hypothetical protein [Novosphingobium capsulatum]|nr:hypothetical protein [Novosphingobium capsulatum]
MRGIFLSRSSATGSPRAALLASALSASALLIAAPAALVPAQAQAQTAAATGQPATTQPITPAVPAPTLPTLNSPSPAPVIKPAAPAGSNLLPTAPTTAPTVITLPQAKPSRAAATPTRRPATRAETPAAAAAPAPAPRLVPLPQDTATPSATPSPVASPTPDLPPATPLPDASTTSEPAPLASDTPAPDTGASSSENAWWPWAAGIAALAVVIVLFARRRRRAADTTAPEPVIEAPVPVAPPPAPYRPAPRPAPAAPVEMPPSDLAATGLPRGLDVALHADRLSATLVNATLSCRLVLTNHAPHALTDIALSGDMTSAHASRPMDEQLGLAGPELPPLRTIARLEPGQSVTVPAEMRLPLSTILTIRAGAAQLFVPIVRAGVWATREDDGGAAHAHAAFLVGQPAAPGDPAARLQPFRLDQGPRVFETLDQRPMPLPAL